MLRWLVDPSGLTPHGFCLLWRPGLLWTHVISDFTTGMAYVAISLAMGVIVSRRQDVSCRPLVWLFVAFILLCGLTHGLDLVTIWVAAYGVQGVVKAATALVSVVTAITLWRLLPRALAQPSLAQYQALNESLRKNKDFLDRIGTVAGVGGWEFDVASQDVSWSAQTYAIHGVSADYRPTVDSAIDFFTPEARPVIRAAFERGVAQGVGWDLELPMVRADGSQIWARAMGTPVHDAGGDLVRITGAIQDLTDLRDARLALQEASERAVLAAESGGIGIWQWEVAEDILIWDERMRSLYGLEPGAAVDGLDVWRRHLHPQDFEATSQAHQDALAGLRAFDTEFRIVRSDGGVRRLRGTGHVTRDADGRAVRMIGANWDVSESRRLADELAEQHELLSVTLDSIGDGVVTTDVSGRITWLNPAAELMTGWTAQDARSRALSEVAPILHEDTRAPAEDPLAACLAQARVVGVAANTVLIARDGRESAIQGSASPIRNVEGEMLGIVLVFRDVTEQRRLARNLRFRASHDQLTGLVNRAEFDARLSAMLARAHADQRQGAMLFIDLDNFKIVNDTCGHTVGDQLLGQIGGLLCGAVRESDTVARLGGDEFAVLLEDCPLGEAKRLAQGVCDRLEDYRFVHEGRRFRIGASIGVAPVDERWTSPAALQQAADSVCYAAKEKGGNRIHLWQETDESVQSRSHQVQWATRLESALDGKRFKLFGQRIAPLDDLASDARGEVLLRLADGDGALVAPGAFLPAAERFQLATRIDRWVLGEVIARMLDGRVPDRITSLSVNLSGQSVGDRSFQGWAAAILADAGPRVRRRLCLEVTETAVIGSLSDAARFIAQMREMGVAMALDDFGAGASSFGYLKSLPVDILKIDGQFIRDLMTDRLDAAAVRCFVEISKAIGMKTVAEFVERAEQIPLLKMMGIDFAQGYLIHRPEPLEDLAMVVEV